MQGPLVTSVDAVRWAIADRVHDLGGNEQVVDELAMAAAYAMWCMPAAPARGADGRSGFGLSF